MNEAEKKRRFHAIVLEHSDILHRIARRQLSLNGGTYDWGRVEEAVQETLTLAWIKRDEVLAAPNIGGWLVKTLQYVLKNMVRQDQQWSKRLLLAQKDLGPDPIQPSPGAHLELEDLVTLEEFTLLKQVYLERIPYEELCETYGIKKSALAMRVKRAKERFREAYLESEKNFSNSSEQTGPTRHNTSRGGSKR